MKIAEIVATFPPSHGGMGYVCLYNSRELVERGHDVTVFTLDHGQGEYPSDVDNLKIVRLRTPLKYGDAGVVPQLFCRLRDFDVIHLHYPFYGGAEYVYLASLLRSQSYLLTYHMDVYGNNLLKKIAIGLYEPLLTRRIIDRASRIGALSMEHLQGSKVFPLVDQRKIVDMPNGVDIGKFRPREKDRGLMEKYRLDGKVVALFVGNLQPFKGLHLLIDAMTSLRDDNLVLLVVGGGYGESEYRKTVESKGLKEMVIFAGPRAHEGDLPLYYNLGDFLVLPSTHSESFGLVVLEAMASGLPAIVSSLPGPSKLVEDNRDGLIANVGDVEDLRKKIVYLAKEHEIRRSMGEAARGKVLKNYSWARVGDRLEDILSSIAHDGK